MYINHESGVYAEFSHYGLLRSNQYWDDKLNKPTIYYYVIPSTDISLFNLTHV